MPLTRAETPQKRAILCREYKFIPIPHNALQSALCRAHEMHHKSPYFTIMTPLPCCPRTGFFRVRKMFTPSKSAAPYFRHKKRGRPTRDALRNSELFCAVSVPIA
nr:MAG TPA: hypothetical protein [Bacteriophage sp.]